MELIFYIINAHKKTILLQNKIVMYVELLAVKFSLLSGTIIELIAVSHFLFQNGIYTTASYYYYYIVNVFCVLFYNMLDIVN